MKPGQIVTYYPADNDQAVADRNSAKSFPAIITQTFEGSPRVNLIVFVWNGLSPVHSIEPVPEGMDMNEPHDHPYLEISEQSGFGEIGSEIMESIADTQKQLKEHADSFAEANEKIVKDVNEIIANQNEVIASLQKQFNETGARFNEVTIGLSKQIEGLEKSNSVTD